MTINDSIKLPQSENKLRTVSILGSTGSIGRSTVDLLASNMDQYKVVALTAQTNTKLLVEQARILEPEIVAIGDSKQENELRAALSDTSVEIVSGEKSIIEAAERSADLVVSAIVGSAGLRPTLSAIRQGNIVALANKECLVCAGDVVMDEVKNSQTVLLPIASDHTAIFQILSENNFTGFILNPVALDEVFKIADLGERLPQKSTYFHPKLGSGLLFYPLIKDERG